MEKGNVVPISKKDDKQNIKNYRSVSPFPNLQQSSQSIDNMLKYFLNNNLLSSKQSGFRPVVSCVNQLWSIAHDVFTSFDNALEVTELYSFW